MSNVSYNPLNFEKKWQEKWLKDKIYKTGVSNNPNGKFYSLYSYPYPSGAGLYVGHVEGMVANDIVARYYRHKGRSVTLPMGWDAFGLPAENYAIKTGIAPRENTDTAIKTFIEQINNIGISVDWDMEVGSHEPRYYKWTQWIFLQLFKAGLAYKKNAPVNWCPKDETVLANEQVINGKCERCDSEVVQKDMDQWFFKITDFNERLYKDLDKVDWPESTKSMQRNWIGRSEGTKLKFKLKSESELDKYLEVFTTRIDTIFGATFMVIAPEHPILEDSSILNIEEVKGYINDTKHKSELDRQTSKEKSGIKVEGLLAINPFNNEEIPIYVADYVLSNYGSGAIMAVPAHDERDMEFAKKHNIEIIEVIKGDVESEMYTDYGTLINSGEYSGLTSKEAINKMQEWLKNNNLGSSEVNFKLRDWLLSRQRYWGCPIPIVYDPEGNAHPIDESDLPLVLPEDVDFKPTGESPIERSEEFKKRAEDKYGKGWHYEVDTMDTFVDSSWYFLRYFNVNDDTKIFDSETLNFWLPTDLYMIGQEHTVLHLLYSRFFTKFFYDQGLINFDEPFFKMRHMGTILGSDNRKMSKRWGNVLNPNDEIDKYGADTLRIYEMFMGPLEDAKAWNDRAENGVFRFLSRVWDLNEKVRDINSNTQDIEINKLIKKVESDIEHLSFNTAIAKFMEFINFITREESISKEVWSKFLIILAPFAPYITEELWSLMGNAYSIHTQSWPIVDDSKLILDNVSMAIQVNGKVRGVVSVPLDSTEEEVSKLARGDKNVSKYLEGNIKKTIFVKNKVINFLV